MKYGIIVNYVNIYVFHEVVPTIGLMVPKRMELKIL
jgi:hypothetical protein